MWGLRLQFTSYSMVADGPYQGTSTLGNAQIPCHLIFIPPVVVTKSPCPLLILRCAHIPCHHYFIAPVLVIKRQKWPVAVSIFNRGLDPLHSAGSLQVLEEVCIEAHVTSRQENPYQHGCPVIVYTLDRFRVQRLDGPHFPPSSLQQVVWPSGLRRWFQAPVLRGVGSNPTTIKTFRDMPHYLQAYYAKIKYIKTLS